MPQLHLSVREIASGLLPAACDVLFLPGILAYGEVQANPILPVLRRVGDVYTYDYGRARFDGAHAASVVADWIAGRDREVVLFGTSLGGQVALDACRLLDLGVRRHVQVIMVDTPAGLGTMSEIPTWASGVAKAAFGLPQGMVRWVNLPTPGPDQLPKDENIVLYEGMDPEEALLYRDQVREEARLGLGGHEFSKWWGQLHYMGKLDLAQGRTNTAGLSSLTYVACTGNNTTVRQPQAVKSWEAATWSCQVREVPTAHAAFLEAEPIWTGHLTEIFRDMALI